MIWIFRRIADFLRKSSGRKAIEESMALELLEWQANLYRRPQSPEEEMARVMEQMNRQHHR